MKFKLFGLLSALSAAAILTIFPARGVSADSNESSATANAIITVKRSRPALEAKPLASNDVFAYIGKNRTEVTSVQALQGEQGSLQLFIFLDDSTRSGTLGTQLPELKNFIRTLPSSTEVAIGYMRNGGFDLVQGFTSEHDRAANALRLPASTPGINGSPYFALSYLVKHWPSDQSTGRRAVLMLTDGVDRYYETNSTNDPYVDAAIKDSQHFGVLVYSIYMHGAGLYGNSGWGVTMAQSRLDQVAKATGGELYAEGLMSPVSLAPYLSDLTDRLSNQYRVTFVAARNSGLQPVQFRTELPGIKILAPQKVIVRPNAS